MEPICNRAQALRSHGTRGSMEKKLVLRDLPTPHGRSVDELCAVIEALKAELRDVRAQLQR